ncbi:hypothetical protein CYMTET_15283 [Cymbomonas tetramitiformis]|uniref:Uncharacterized protein n=1 Tax=Cymbomonas tetramitiformis TaxID=36881 RepID=A0AAE0GEN9_9CHLO|nr:hypothetical protein CYMTET_15283 [Cymbomonas tetramitiformis]
MSCASAALHLLKISKGDFATLRQKTVGTASFSTLTDAQVVTHNLLEAIRLVGTKAAATEATAERAFILIKKSDTSARSEQSGATGTTRSGPSAQTLRRRNLRTARSAKEQSDKSDTAPTDPSPPRAETASETPHTEAPAKPKASAGKY